MRRRSAGTHDYVEAFHNRPALALRSGIQDLRVERGRRAGALVAAHDELVGDQGGEEVERREAAGLRLEQADLQALGHARGAELAQGPAETSGQSFTALLVVTSVLPF